jgi:hypothetical protein
VIVKSVHTARTTLKCLRKRAPDRIGVDPRKGAISKCPTIECLAAATGGGAELNVSDVWVSDRGVDRPQLATLQGRQGMSRMVPESRFAKSFLCTNQVSQRYLATTVCTTVANSICRTIIPEQLSAWTRPFKLSCHHDVTSTLSCRSTHRQSRDLE